MFALIRFVKQRNGNVILKSNLVERNQKEEKKI